MVTVNQPNAHIVNQYNADTINFYGVQTPFEFAKQLETLRQQLHALPDSGDEVEKSDKALSEAIAEANKPVPNSSKIKTAIEAATGFIRNLSAAAGLVEALTQGAKLALTIF